MELNVGSIVSGKVTGITGFGAFITFGENQTGLCHISEIAPHYVSNVRDVLTEGQDVNVKIIGTTPEGRINLSIKKTLPQQSPPAGGNRRGGVRREPNRPGTFEEQLKAYMSDSESKLHDLRQQSGKRGNRGRRK